MAFANVVCVCVCVLHRTTSEHVQNVIKMFQRFISHATAVNRSKNLTGNFPPSTLLGWHFFGLRF